MMKTILLTALVVTLVCALVEAVVLHLKRRNYDWGSYRVSMVNMAARTVVTIVVPLTLITPLAQWAWTHRITTVPLDGIWAFVLLFVGQEFCYYWFHRASHRMRWFWANHAVHHSPNDLTLAAALRLGVFGRFIGTGLFFVPLIWLGFPPEVVFATLSLNLLYQFWIHAEWVPKLGWLEGWINTPSAHRVHHAANLEYLDANYGGVLLVFDRLFGTYTPERDDVAIRYGLVEPIRSTNPVAVELVEWRKLARDLARSRSLREVLGHVFMPPGWQANGQHLTTEALRAQANTPVAQPAAAPQSAAEAAYPGLAARKV